jgi:hypothetical protein
MSDLRVALSFAVQKIAGNLPLYGQFTCKPKLRSSAGNLIRVWSCANSLNSLKGAKSYQPLSARYANFYEASVIERQRSRGQSHNGSSGQYPEPLQASETRSQPNLKTSAAN